MHLYKQTELSPNFTHMGNNKEKWNILRALELTQEKETDEEVISWLRGKD
jgi:hypothetical protein